MTPGASPGFGSHALLASSLVEPPPGAEPPLTGFLFLSQPLNSPAGLGGQPDAGERQGDYHLVGDPGASRAILMKGRRHLRRRQVGREEGKREVTPQRSRHLVLDDVRHRTPLRITYPRKGEVAYGRIPRRDDRRGVMRQVGGYVRQEAAL